MESVCVFIVKIDDIVHMIWLRIDVGALYYVGLEKADPNLTCTLYEWTIYVPLFIYFTDYYFYYDYVTLTHIFHYYYSIIVCLYERSAHTYIADLLMEVLYNAVL